MSSVAAYIFYVVNERFINVYKYHKRWECLFVMKYGNEGMDIKKLLIFLLRRFYIVALAAAAGALIGGGLYILHNVALAGNREYQAQSKAYLDFAPDETGEAYQYYNGYTWNDLMSTDLILDRTMSYLPDGYSEEEVVSATLAEIISDVRLLTVTITTPDMERTAQILEATDKALVELGEKEKEFTGIEIIKETEPKLLVADDRLLQAVLVGTVLALAFALIGMALFYVLDDRIYVPMDLRGVTDIAFAGFSFSGAVYEGTDGAKEPDANMQEKPDETKEPNAKTQEKPYGIKEPNAKAQKKSAKLKERLQSDTESNIRALTLRYGGLERVELKKADIKEDWIKENQIKENQVKENQIEEDRIKEDQVNEAEIKNAGLKAVLLVIPYGGLDRASLEYGLERLSLRQRRVAGIIIEDADMRFMRWYYNHL